MKFEFATATRIVFGPDAASQLGQNVKNYGHRALVVTGSNPQRAGRILSNLSENSLSAVLFSVVGEPEISKIENGVALAKKEACDVVISFGGGSVIDAGKAIAAMMNNDGALLEYLEI